MEFEETKIKWFTLSFGERFAFIHVFLERRVASFPKLNIQWIAIKLTNRLKYQLMLYSFRFRPHTGQFDGWGIVRKPVGAPRKNRTNMKEQFLSIESNYFRLVFKGSIIAREFSEHAKDDFAITNDGFWNSTNLDKFQEFKLQLFPVPPILAICV